MHPHARAANVRRSRPAGDRITIDPTVSDATFAPQGASVPVIHAETLTEFAAALFEKVGVGAPRGADRFPQPDRRELARLRLARRHADSVLHRRHSRRPRETGADAANRARNACGSRLRRGLGTGAGFVARPDGTADRQGGRHGRGLRNVAAGGPHRPRRRVLRNGRRARNGRHHLRQRTRFRAARRSRRREGRAGWERIRSASACPGEKTGPFILDFGTSATAEGKVRVKKIAGQSVPLGWILDADGNPTTDPNKLTATRPAAFCRWGATRRTRDSAWRS